MPVSTIAWWPVQPPLKYGSCMHAWLGMLGAPSWGNLGLMGFKRRICGGAGSGSPMLHGVMFEVADVATRGACMVAQGAEKEGKSS